ncbi:hypothetical protein GCM10011375_32750 [Hymenobacter qilianensis]|uniref:Uncharacterized protein n=2 Tax=Hymenobacter qilianensis TaxID=1385715 RepID=A0ACB5PVB5_9BACT|nr:hypothetical protein [Hymenobacter qilianensis]QNP51443.1 hypothetical protein H9L05_15645 [Hymenobacter qilianensis]GGF75104.1 hypothetical protein GCM10011375_32750 [Hymenobacter qilianensis]
MPKIYKYISSQFAGAMLDSGTIRVGTIYSYRKDENIEVGDSGEGVLTVERRLPDFTGANVSSKDIPAGVFPVFFSEGTTFSKVIIQDNYVHNDRNYPDVYIYCTTKEPNKDVMKSFGADTCVEIADNHKFHTLIAEEMMYSKKLIHGLYLHKSCIYEGRIVTRDSLDNYWMKEPRHIHQREVRLVMPPKEVGSTIEPVLISNPDIGKLCSIYKF